MNSKKKRAIRCLVAALAFKKASTKKQKNFWTKPWLGRRNQLGVCRTLLQELKNEDSDSFRNFLRCSPQQFLFLLNLIKDKIARKTTNMRSPIQPGERLAVTLRYLATGESFCSLSYTVRISPSTIRQIVLEVCEALYLTLKDNYLKVPSSSHEWLTIAKDFNEKWNFPNCLGAVDGKHVVIQAPNNYSGSFYYNYKNTNSLVLMAAVDASYRFIYVDVGTNFRTSDGGTFQNCSLNQALECNDLNIPEPTPLPSRNKPTPYVFVADEAFPLKENIMRPCPQPGGLDDSRRIFNYRLSRTRRIVENAFGILCNRFRVMRAPILLSPEKVTHVVMACCALHNYLRPESFFGLQETDNIEINNLMPPMARGGYHSSSKARDIREEYKEYFTNIGQVPWQHKVLS